MTITTLQVNEFEKKTKSFIELLKSRYDLDKLHKAFVEQLQAAEASKNKK